MNHASPEGSVEVARRIAVAGSRQVERQGCPNARLSGRALRWSCALSGAAQAQAIRLADLEGWSARGTERLLRVARTIADLAGVERVHSEHLDEAARFRSPSRQSDGTRAAG